MFPKLDAKKMQAMMKQLGMKQEDIPAERVIIEKADGKIIIENPSITKINMQGQESFQITGEISEEEVGQEDNTEHDIKTIMEKTKCTEKQAKEALEKSNGDLASAIIGLNNR